MSNYYKQVEFKKTILKAIKSNSYLKYIFLNFQHEVIYILKCNTLCSHCKLFDITKYMLMPISRSEEFTISAKGNSTEEAVITGCPLSLHKLP